MTSWASQEYDAVIVGGGFYGCCLALTLRTRFRRILIVERESELLSRASYANQARVHNGYHYPRSLLTASRSAANYPLFKKEFADCIDESFVKVYGIARGSSKVTAYQFLQFCRRAGIPARKAPDAIARLFNPALIEETFFTEECAFDAVRLRDGLRKKLDEQGIAVLCGEEVDRLEAGKNRNVRVIAKSGRQWEVHCAFNCTYARLNEVLARSGLPKLPLKHEMTELALIQMPPALEKLGITVMDGPFFSSMPFPARQLHTLSHVTYTPHASWNDLEQEQTPRFPARLPSKHIFMMRDSERYLPSLREARYVDSHFEMKTVLLQNEVDDGRPILCRCNYGIKGLYVVLGAKIDNIYDINQVIEKETFTEEVKHELYQ